MKFNEDVISDSYNYCKNLATAHYENFPVGSLLIPKNKRKYVYSIYAFARTADDIADSYDNSEVKLLKLNKLENDFKNILKDDFIITDKNDFNNENYNFLIALYDTIKTLSIPMNEFINLLTAFKQDSTIGRYDKFDDLIEYSKFSANPIGHLILYLFGYNEKDNKQLFDYSDKICTALQLTNFWQDVSVDLEIDRVYIPKELMDLYGYSYDDLFKKKQNENFRELIKSLTEKTRMIFKEGYELINNVNGRLKWELKLTYNGGNEILNKIEKIDYNVLSKRVKLSKWDFLKMIW
ncbi:MAG TPA: squalene synthase HpnC [Ignavibacteria bacterium]|nr:squalene synthase HpnC [Ignavibacteria bacterium]